MDYTVKVVEQDGTVVVADLARVNCGAIVRTLNEARTFSFSFPKGSADAPDVTLLDKEIQVFRSGDTNPRFWGPMVSADTDAGSAEVTVQCVDPYWYLMRRQISDARANLVLNGSMESGSPPSNWTNSGASTDSSSTTHVVLGTKALKLTQAAAGVDTHNYQQVSVTGTAIGTYLTVAAWVYIDDTAWIGPAFESRGLFVQGSTAGPTLRDFRFVEIDDATPRNRWVRLETGIWIPPNETQTIEVRLYAPGGECWWDAVSMTAMESLSRYASDAGSILGDVIDFAAGSSHGWSDINLATSDATTSLIIDRHVQYADHEEVSSIVQEFEDLGIDWSIEVTPTVRTFTSYWPQKGTDRSATVTFSMRSPSNPTGNLSDYRLTVDGAATTTRVTVLGEGDGPDREEGYAADASALGGLVLGEVINARPNAPIDALTTIASERLASSKNLVRILEVTGLPGDATTVTTCVEGDTVAVSLSDGWVSIASDWRIVRKTLDPATDTASFVLNEVL